MSSNAGKSEAGGVAPVHELRLVVTARDYDDAVTFYRDVLNLRELAAFSGEGGRVAILAAGVATLEIGDERHAAYVDRVEVGRRVAGHIRVAFRVDDASRAVNDLASRGATIISEARRTPWGSRNGRLDGPADLHLTVFSEDASSTSSETVSGSVKAEHEQARLGPRSAIPSAGPCR
jgi:lactoylglutathione lyase